MLQQLQTVVISLLCIASFAASNGCNRSTSTPLPANTVFTIHVDDFPLSLELALTESEQIRGLMFREYLAEDHGMLFVFRTPGPRSFWMQNTSIPLDIAYLTADGVIQEIHPLHPYNLNSVVSRRSDILLALEMNRGWFRKKGIRPGSRIRLDDLTTALQKRGVDPSHYPFVY